jgi:dynactin complex subunit
MDQKSARLFSLISLQEDEMFKKFRKFLDCEKMFELSIADIDRNIKKLRNKKDDASKILAEEIVKLKNIQEKVNEDYYQMCDQNDELSQTNKKLQGELNELKKMIEGLKKNSEQNDEDEDSGEDD